MQTEPSLPMFYFEDRQRAEPGQASLAGTTQYETPDEPRWQKLIHTGRALLGGIIMLNKPRASRAEWETVELKC
eukprot:3402936-Pleurochrysis_carterae.AAC.1